MTESLEEDIVKADEKLELRTGECSAPTEGCDPPEVKMYEIQLNNTFPPCTYEVTMTVTECGDEIFFEDNGFSIVGMDSNGNNCTVTSSVAEELFNRFIELYMRFEGDLPNCGDEATKTSNFLKANCVRLCESVGFEGETNYGFFPCSTEAGCCITIKEWCFDGEGEASCTFISSEIISLCGGQQIGCDGNPLPIFTNGSEGPCEARCPYE